MRALMAERSTAGAGAPADCAADLASLTEAASVSDCARRLATSARKAAADFSMASRRAVEAGSVTGFWIFDSRAATRLPRSSTAAALTCGDVDGAFTSGQPSSQPTRITRLAAAAPENGAITQGETGREPGTLEAVTFSGSDCSGCGGSAAPSDFPGCACPRSASAALDSVAVSETLLASRSIVGGARLTLPESG